MRTQVASILLLASFLFSFGDYQNDRPLIDKISGVNINLAAWDWHPNNHNQRDGFTPSEFWVYLSYYHQRKYAVNLVYAARENLDNYHNISATYNTLLGSKFINRSGILIDRLMNEEPLIALYTSLSYDSNVISNVFKFNYQLSYNYNISNQSDSNLFNCFTLSIVPDPEVYELFFSYWFRGKPIENKNWLAFGVNFFINSKYFSKN